MILGIAKEKVSVQGCIDIFSKKRGGDMKVEGMLFGERSNDRRLLDGESNWAASMGNHQSGETSFKAVNDVKLHVVRMSPSSLHRSNEKPPRRPLNSDPPAAHISTFKLVNEPTLPAPFSQCNIP